MIEANNIPQSTKEYKRYDSGQADMIEANNIPQLTKGTSGEGRERYIYFNIAKYNSP
jgi:hypothetical protein